MATDFQNVDLTTDVTGILPAANGGTGTTDGGAGVAAAAVASHVADSDPHTQYQRESEKGAASGYASLDGSTKIPVAQIPTHASTHQSGGSDSIKLDDLATPDDNSDLNASTSHHGLLPKLDNDASHFLNGAGGWTIPAGSNPSVLTGTVLMWAASSIPSGYLECVGGTQLIASYPNLASILGTTWGGNGTTTFGIPDLRGRAPIGVGTGTGLTARALAATGGAETHTLATGEIPAHSHALPGTEAPYTFTGSGTDSHNWSVSGGGNQQAKLTFNLNNTGGGGAHNNMQPWVALKFIIKT